MDISSCFGIKRGLGKRKSTIKWLIIIGLLAPMLCSSLPAGLYAEEVFITIGGGDFTGVYFPTGQGIAELINSRRQDHGMRATVEATPGSIFNLNAILAGYQQFGLAQADHQHRAFHGLEEWEQKGPQSDLRSVFSIYQEALTLIAAADAGIETVADLAGKRVSLGIPGSGQHRIAKISIEAFGLDPEKDLVALEATAAEAPNLLQDNRIDAYFFVVGHPSESIRQALSRERKARIVPIAGPSIDRLVADNVFYQKERIAVRELYPELPGPLPDIETFGVMATFCSSARISDKMVYRLTKEVFENLDDIRHHHPALTQLTRERMLRGMSAPLHSGAIRYYREAGLLP